jgi:hypothetical protein
MPLHCALDQEAPQVYTITLAGTISPAVLHNFRDRLLLWLFLRGAPSILAYHVGHNFPPVLKVVVRACWFTGNFSTRRGMIESSKIVCKNATGNG